MSTIDDIRLDMITKNIPTQFFVLDGLEIELFELYETLYHLDKADGFSVIAFIDNTDLENFLELHQVAFRLTRGGYRRCINFNEFCKKVGYENEHDK